MTEQEVGVAILRVAYQFVQTGCGSDLVLHVHALAVGEELPRYVLLAREYQVKSSPRFPYSNIPLKDMECITAATLLNLTMRYRSKQPRVFF